MPIRTNRLLIGSGLALVIVVFSLPWVIYAVGLTNVEGRPSVPTGTLSETEAHIMWSDAKEKGEIQIERLTPWHYAWLFLKGDVNESFPGQRMAWFVARDYNLKNLKDGRMLYWHISGAALTIWLTRNWSAEQLLAKAYELREQAIATKRKDRN